MTIPANCITRGELQHLIIRLSSLGTANSSFEFRGILQNLLAALGNLEGYLADLVLQGDKDVDRYRHVFANALAFLSTWTEAKIIAHNGDHRLTMSFGQQVLTREADARSRRFSLGTGRYRLTLGKHHHTAINKRDLRALAEAYLNRHAENFDEPTRLNCLNQLLGLLNEDT